MRRIRGHRLSRSLLLGVGVVALGLAPPASAASFVFDVSLDGATVAPVSVATDSTGTATIVYDDVTKLLSITATLDGILVSDLNPVAEGSPFHLHLGPTVTIGPIALIFGTPGDFAPVFTGPDETGSTITLNDLFVPDHLVASNSIFNLADFEEAVLATDVSRAFVQVHTFSFPPGEIRGNLGPLPAPEPAAALTLGAALLALAARRARARGRMRRAGWLPRSGAAASRGGTRG